MIEKAIENQIRKAKDVTETRLYLETMEEILPKVEKIIIDDEVNNMINLLPLGNIDQKEVK